MKGLKYFSTFTGIGGLDMGLEELGAKCVGFSEIKETSIRIYNRHYPEHKNFGDITQIKPDELPDFDILTGGFPCQTFSVAAAVAGNSGRQGFEDRRGQMIFYLFDILKAKQPQFAIFENVTGIKSHNKGQTLVDVVRVLMQAGYFVRVIQLNAMNYGSAQSRERVLFLCSKKDFKKKRPEVKDASKRFRDIKDTKGPFKEFSRTARNQEKVQQRHAFSCELVGGYDRVGTLTTGYGCGEKVVGYNDYVRHLTPVECERLQGFPDGWTEGESEGARYFALGNAVNCDVSRYLFKDYLKGLWY